MKRIIFPVVLGLVATLCMVSPARATCGDLSQPFVHNFDGFFKDCPDAQPVDAFAYKLGAFCLAIPTRTCTIDTFPAFSGECFGFTPCVAGSNPAAGINSSTVDIACEVSGRNGGIDGLGSPCQDAAGIHFRN